jgi:hypothetical protein
MFSNRTMVTISRAALLAGSATAQAVDVRQLAAHNDGASGAHCHLVGVTDSQWGP